MTERDGALEMEWLLCDDGTWVVVDPLDDLRSLADDARKRAQGNRAMIHASRALCERVKQRLHQHRLSRTLRALCVTTATIH